MTKARQARKAASGSKLTPKQAVFVDEYLLDLNATQAAIRAGYSADSAASIGEENLKKPEIAAAVRRAMDNRAERTRIAQDRVVEELKAIGFAKITDVINWKTYDLADIEKQSVQAKQEWDEDGEEGVGDAIPIGVFFTDVKFRDSAELPPNIAAAIAGVKKDAQGKLSISMHDKKGALVTLGRHLGMFDSKTKVTPGNDGSVTVEIQRFGK